MVALDALSEYIDKASPHNARNYEQYQAAKAAQEAAARARQEAEARVAAERAKRARAEFIRRRTSEEILKTISEKKIDIERRRHYIEVAMRELGDLQKPSKLAASIAGRVLFLVFFPGGSH